MPKDNSRPGDKGLDPSRWVSAHGDILFRFALTRLQDPAAAEEVVQETFLAALKSLASFKGQSSERTWLVGILKHKIIDFLRKNTRELPNDEIDAVVDSFFDDTGMWKVHPAAFATPDASAETGELRDHLQGCIDALPDGQSRLFLLTQVDGMATDEVCKLLKITATNVWTTLHRARLRLRRCLEGIGVKPGGW